MERAKVRVGRLLPLDEKRVTTSRHDLHQST